MTYSVTVVIPAHNCEREIDACLHSVFTQTCPPTRVIVVNDASTDATCQRLAEWQRPGLMVLDRQTPGAGGYAARNLAVSIAQTPWVAFLDADDVWEPHHLETLCQGLDTHHSISFAATGRRDVADGPGSPGAPDRLTLTASQHCELLDLGSYVDYAARGLEPFLTSCVMMKRELFDAVGGFPEMGFRRGGDADLWLRAIAATGTALRIHRATCQYWKKRQGSVTALRLNVSGQHPIVETAARLAREAQDVDTHDKLYTFAQEKQFRWLQQTGGLKGRVAALKTVSFSALTWRGKLKFVAFLTGVSAGSGLFKAFENWLFASRNPEALAEETPQATRRD